MKLATEDLAVARGEDRVFSGVTATVEPGEFVGLVGPNGAGKTTLLRTVAGMLDPASGTASLGGDPVAGLSARETARRVAVVPQNPALTFEFTVREVVAMGRHPQRPRLGGDPEPGLVDRALERTRTARFADRPITAVSGGERQRVLLARALAQDTPGLLLDEPTASLDVAHQVRTLDIVRDLADDGRTVLAAIHDLDLAARYCDRLLVLADGGLRAAGPPGDVLTPDLLADAFDARAVVDRDPATDSPRVTALSRERGEGEGEETAARRVHVLGSDDAVALVRRLDDAGHDVSAGPVPAGGRTAALADARDLDCVTAPAFGDVPGDARDRAAELAAESDVTVLDALDRHPGVAPLLDAAADAARLVAVTGGRSADGPTETRYQRLLDRAALVPDESGALEAVRGTRETPPAIGGDS